MSDYGYQSHTRTVGSIGGVVERGRKGVARKGDNFFRPGVNRIIENRVNGHLRTITVLDHNGKRIVRLHGLHATFNG